MWLHGHATNIKGRCNLQTAPESFYTWEVAKARASFRKAEILEKNSYGSPCIYYNKAACLLDLLYWLWTTLFNMDQPVYSQWLKPHLSKHNDFFKSNFSTTKMWDLMYICLSLLNLSSQWPSAARFSQQWCMWHMCRRKRPKAKITLPTQQQLLNTFNVVALKFVGDNDLSFSGLLLRTLSFQSLFLSFILQSFLFYLLQIRTGQLFIKQNIFKNIGVIILSQPWYT